MCHSTVNDKTIYDNYYEHHAEKHAKHKNIKTYKNVEKNVEPQQVEKLRNYLIITY